MYLISGFMLLFFGSVFMFIGLLFLNLNYCLFIDWELVSINSCMFSMSILFDWMSLIFMSCVLMISSMVVLYSHSYMMSDFNKIRFLFLVLMFILSMMFMIISPDLVSILLGWDGLGLVSYALVIYFQNYNSYNSGMLTVLTNRIGDVAILISIAWMFNFGGWHYIFYLNYMNDYMYMIMILLVVAAFTKSAQIPFSSWLPAAMAAPTPVSALVHSSTLVTAGVYLMIRFSSLFMNYDCFLLIFISFMTMFFSGLSAMFEFDLKKIIALSTLSQLGLMMSILFLGFPVFSFFHLLSHAFFKALLFLCAGLIIHLMSNSQDIRHMGGVLKYIPWTCSCFCISNMSLCGLPFLSGFYSKDMILESVSFYKYNFIMYLIFFISICLTTMYTFRLLYYSVFSNMGCYTFQSYSEDKFMTYPMFLLTMMSIFFGSVLSWCLIPYPEIIFIDIYSKLLPLSLVLISMFLGYLLTKINYSMPFIYKMNFITWFSGLMWFMPKFSTYMIYSGSLNMSLSYMKNMDYGWGEYLISKHFFNMFSYFSSKMNIYHLNNLKMFFITFLIYMLMF
uniref:NADH dehydrogenase subunit 5 n=1 Tax=Orius strigicollis TaxID=82748 RepID=UPI00211447F9|nr:NADH dehydrogenase subunit 5 [Orius strigicollis]USW04722.1 NADH dehydrogenase subunit 5 [Orius strigicollis]